MHGQRDSCDGVINVRYRIDNSTMTSHAQDDEDDGGFWSRIWLDDGGLAKGSLKHDMKMMDLSMPKRYNDLYDDF